VRRKNDATSMKHSISPADQSEIDTLEAFIIAVGVLAALGGLFPAFDFLMSRDINIIHAFLPFGAALTACGFALKRRRRHAWAASMIVCMLGLALFPIGTILCLLMIRMLWKNRSIYQVCR
jgi:hypothetical protein